MMGQLDRDPIPPYAITMWTNDVEIFVAIPCKGSIPYITSFPLNEGGLTKALNLLRDRPKEVITPTAAAPANYTKPPVQPQVKRGKIAERLHSETTEDQRARAAALIAQMLGKKP